MKIIFTILILSFINLFSQIPAFPGAEGFGSTTIGGRGGVVIEVTNINASGQGSLKEAIETSGSRIVGLKISDNSAPIYNLIIDHCSISWGIDENVQLYRAHHDITIQWNIVSEGLRNSLHPKGEHSNGILVGMAGASTEISIHHNLMAHNLRRNPMIASGNTAEVINNIVYNWEIGTTITGEVDVIANVYKVGNNTGNAKGVILPPWAPTVGFIYVKDNIGPGRENNTGDDWLIVDGSDDTRLFNPVFPSSFVHVDDVEDVFDLVLDNVGAIAPHWDVVDQRIIQDVKNGTGYLIDSQDDVGGWPVLSSGTPWPDIDNDGMDDDWEIDFFGNLAMTTNGDHDGDGYLNIEEYINSKLSGVITAIDDEVATFVKSFDLKQNYPNPFNPKTTIEYNIAKNSHVLLEVYNIMGQHVSTLVNEELNSGTYSVIFNATNLPSGIYYYKIQVENFREIYKMVLIK